MNLFQSLRCQCRSLASLILILATHRIRLTLTCSCSEFFSKYSQFTINLTLYETQVW